MKIEGYAFFVGSFQVPPFDFSEIQYVKVYLKLLFMFML